MRDTTHALSLLQCEGVEPNRESESSVTLVAAGETELERWSASQGAGQYMLVPDTDMLESMLRSPVVRATGEITRVVFDGVIDLDRYLLLIATLPARFTGEILFIREDGSGYLSTRELKSERTVKAISGLDVEVYLRWHGLPARSRQSYAPPPDQAPKDH